MIATNTKNLFEKVELCKLNPYKNQKLNWLLEQPFYTVSFLQFKECFDYELIDDRIIVYADNKPIKVVQSSLNSVGLRKWYNHLQTKLGFLTFVVPDLIVTDIYKQNLIVTDYKEALKQAKTLSEFQPIKGNSKENEHCKNWKYIYRQLSSLHLLDFCIY